MAVASAGNSPAAQEVVKRVATYIMTTPHRYTGDGTDAMELTETVSNLSDLASGGQRYGDATAEEEGEFGNEEGLQDGRCFLRATRLRPRRCSSAWLGTSRQGFSSRPSFLGPLAGAWARWSSLRPGAT